MLCSLGGKNAGIGGECKLIEACCKDGNSKLVELSTFSADVRRQLESSEEILRLFLGST